jgi:ubiquinone/menaquinone biosynthesis C-methylase UbiE
LPGRLEAVDASSLPLADGSVDHVYSFGVIHHTPSPEAVVDEMYRVLRPGGSFCVMLYNKTSVNYVIEISVLRRLLRLVLAPSFGPALLSRLTGLDAAKLKEHRRILVSGEKMTKERWISINTDGPLCPLARVYGEGDVRRLFGRFVDVSTEVRYFDKSHWPGLNRLLSDRLCDWIGDRWGWHRMIYGRKPVVDAR